jgi:hypothetical protein
MPRAICKIRKEGEIEVTGSLRLVFDAVAVQIAKAGEEKLNFFSGRSLKDSQYKPRPLSIDFKHLAFEKIESVRAFVDVLRIYPHSLHAVEHGNPYAHVKVTDMFDGSCFDIWAVPPQRIALIPGLKASEGAFERIVHYIFERFKEGDVVEYA